MSAEYPRGKGSADGSTDAADKEFSCPTCDRDDFKSQSGVKIHHSKIHNESIAGVEVSCAWCDKTLRRRKYRVEGNDNQFCDESCQGQYYQNCMKPSEAPRWEGGKEMRDCEICGKGFETHPGRETRFCSRKCHGKFISKTQSGEGHPNWKGGKVNYYGENWQQQRDKARKRDDGECQICSVTEEELDRELDVHHITPVRIFKDNYGEMWWKKANKLDNLICVCQSCHQKWEGIPLRPQ